MTALYMTDTGREVEREKAISVVMRGKSKQSPHWNKSDCARNALSLAVELQNRRRAVICDSVRLAWTLWEVD